ncbi:MAG: mevalonate kinase [Candidatus Levyibacteriota bacterium]
MITVSTPGKIHLLGEHVVVYGNPALLTAIDRRCVVQLIPRKNDTIEIIAENIQRRIMLSSEEIHEQTKNARKKWMQYQASNDSILLASITQDALSYAILAIGETLRYYKIKAAAGFTLKIHSEIPIGAGLGSSAALAVSIAAAITMFLREEFSKEVINEIAFRIEQMQHGMPSGGDNTAACFGGVVWFQKGSSDSVHFQESIPSVSVKLAKSVILIDSGKPEESTGEMVSFVRKLKKENPQLVIKILKEQEVLANDFLSAMQQNEATNMRVLIKKAEKNLERLGVVSSKAMSIIRAIEKAGGVAKISGAGGRTDGSGIIVAMHTDPSILERLAQKRMMPSYNVKLGGEGVIIQ